MYRQNTHLQVIIPPIVHQLSLNHVLVCVYLKLCFTIRTFFLIVAWTQVRQRRPLYSATTRWFVFTLRKTQPSSVMAVLTKQCSNIHSIHTCKSMPCKPHLPKGFNKTPEINEITPNITTIKDFFSPL